MAIYTKKEQQLFHPYPAIQNICRSLNPGLPAEVLEYCIETYRTEL